MQGTVIKSSGSVYGVRATDGTLVDCRVKGNFRLKGIRSTNPVAVGDHVLFDVREDGTPEDVAKDGEESLQKIHDKYIKKAEEIFAAKEKEIMTV